MNRVHGLADKMPEYFVWEQMRQRCRNPKAHNYDRYGARGISVCERWDSFELFLADMGRRPAAHYTLERRDNNGNYEPGNCRWATHRDQRRNTRQNRNIEYLGLTMCLWDWSERLGIHYETLRGRLARGWSVEAALSTRPPVRR